MEVMFYDVVVIGGGPAGLAAAEAAGRSGSNVLIIERESRLGGILKQCIHDGFGVVRFGEKLSGPEYAARYTKLVQSVENIKVVTDTFVVRVEKRGEKFDVTVTSRQGISHVESAAVVLATGCRERSAKQVSIHGTRPAGVYQAGTAQYLVNMMGELPVKKCVILGSGDIGLIMARRLTLEGCEVVGVYEAKPVCSGLSRNVAQCLTDFNIPLHLSKTVTKVFGKSRVEAVEISSVDENMHPIAGTEERVDCDGLILSVGLIPENEIAEMFGVEISNATKGAVVDEQLMTNVSGVFAAGNCLHVNDLVDYVSESGMTAGLAAAEFAKNSARGNPAKSYAHITVGNGIAYVVPQKVSSTFLGETVVYFRVRSEVRNAVLLITADGETVLSKKYQVMRPPEMERLKADFRGASEIRIELTEVE